MEKRELKLRKFDRRRNVRGARFFITSEVGSVTIERIKSNRDNHRYGRRNRRESDDDDDD